MGPDELSDDGGVEVKADASPGTPVTVADDPFATFDEWKGEVDRRAYADL